VDGSGRKGLRVRDVREIIAIKAGMFESQTKEKASTRNARAWRLVKGGSPSGGKHLGKTDTTISERKVSHCVREKKAI